MYGKGTETRHEKTNISDDYAKTKAQISFAVTAKLISVFVVATGIVDILFFLNPNFPASSHLLCLYSSVCVGPVRKLHCWLLGSQLAQVLILSTWNDNEPLND